MTLSDAEGGDGFGAGLTQQSQPELPDPEQPGTASVPSRWKHVSSPVQSPSPSQSPWHRRVFRYIVMAYIAMACIVMPHVVMAITIYLGTDPCSCQILRGSNQAAPRSSSPSQNVRTQCIPVLPHSHSAGSTLAPRCSRYRCRSRPGTDPCMCQILRGSNRAAIRLYSYGQYTYGLHIVMACIVMAYIVMAHIVMPYIVMAYIVHEHVATPLRRQWGPRYIET